jgi:hypothetical protein
MPLVGTSLNAATAAGAGVAVTFDTPKTDVSMQVATTGGPTFNVDFEVSLDGIHWVAARSFGSPGISNLQGTGAFPVLSARANLTSLSGGTSPTVTAVVNARDNG